MTDFEKTYREYSEMIHAFLLRLCGNAHLAEELTQETFYLGQPFLLSRFPAAL